MTVSEMTVTECISGAKISENRHFCTLCFSDRRSFYLYRSFNATRIVKSKKL
jgi:hypothetical protein